MVTWHWRRYVKWETVEIKGHFTHLSTSPLCERMMILAWDSQNIYNIVHMEDFLESDCTVDIFNNGSCSSCYSCKLQSSRGRGDSKFIRKINVGGNSYSQPGQIERCLIGTWKYISHKGYFTKPKLKRKEALTMPHLTLSSPCLAWCQRLCRPCTNVYWMTKGGRKTLLHSARAVQDLPLHLCFHFPGFQVSVVNGSPKIVNKKFQK